MKVDYIKSMKFEASHPFVYSCIAGIAELVDRGMCIGALVGDGPWLWYSGILLETQLLQQKNCLDFIHVGEHTSINFNS